MSSYDEIWRVERYPSWNGKFNEYSYGCPNLNLMGYIKVYELLEDMKGKIMDIEIQTLKGEIKELNEQVKKNE